MPSFGSFPWVPFRPPLIFWPFNNLSGASNSEMPKILDLYRSDTLILRPLNGLNIKVPDRYRSLKVHKLPLPPTAPARAGPRARHGARASARAPARAYRARAVRMHARALVCARAWPGSARTGTAVPAGDAAAGDASCAPRRVALHDYALFIWET